MPRRRSRYAAECADADKPIMLDEFRVPWYVVIEQSRRFVEEWKEERRAQRMRRLQVLEAGDGVEMVDGVELPPTGAAPPGWASVGGGSGVDQGSVQVL
ncbi:hypothetical protein [Streptomyces alkaliterrae]|uniref:Uncharacterized protein n=1 Tax=Streptomyces alkaliterrae TaxID=2213162 RepID=A0A5P0Z0C2_9ACTN|nr:hypothetical protein [Streptomyces alkaliterrae]MBB1259963.1 hypothetical protein [Streptomyces alkaliterrae]MQS05019.1 hypothetical protein [Streptomyces alkaliterrae]